MKVETYGFTDTGLKRSENEDMFCICDDIGLYIVADGMGGHAAGEVASSQAVEFIEQFIRRCSGDADFTWPFGLDKNLSKTENILSTGIKLANRKICSLARQHPEYHGMGTTIVAVLLSDKSAAIAHIGDSRLYRIRDNRITQATTDHTWVNEQVMNNVISEEEARSHRWRNVITRALGNKMEVDIDITRDDFQPGDLYLLCSDGLSGMVQDDRILEIILENNGDLKKTAEFLIHEANKNGGIDNITAVLIKRME